MSAAARAFPSRCRARRPRSPSRSLQAAPKAAAGRLAGTVVLCIDNERTILDGMQTLLGGWGCRVLKAADLAEALAAIEGSGSSRTGFWSTITSTAATASAPSPNCAAATAATCRRSWSPPTAPLHVREEARAAGVHVLNKPVKPASLRALITQWRVQRVAAE